MRVSLWIAVLFLWGCASNGGAETPSVPTKEVKPGHQSALVQVQNSSKKELVAMMCSATKITQAKQLLLQHQVLLVKQSSPTVLTLSWTDARSAKQVKQLLQKDKTVFCGIENNQTYSIQPQQLKRGNYK